MPRLPRLLPYEGTYPGCDATGEELEFLKAIERFQRLYRRRYPSFREVLYIARSLGYRKVEPAVPLPDPRRMGEGEAPPDPAA